MSLCSLIKDIGTKLTLTVSSLTLLANTAFAQLPNDNTKILVSRSQNRDIIEIVFSEGVFDPDNPESSLKSKIYRLDTQKGAVDLLFYSTDSNIALVKPAYSEDKKSLAFINFDYKNKENIEIYVVEPNRSQPRRLTNNNLHEQSFSWSPDGKKILFVAGSRTDNYTNSIYAINIDGTNEKIVYLNKKGDISNAVWSKDGKKIAFDYNIRDESGIVDEVQIKIMDLNNNNIITLPGNDVDEVDLSWSPGDKILASGFEDDEESEDRLGLVYSIDPRSGYTEKLAICPESCDSPIWVNNNTILVVATYPKLSNYEIYKMDIRSKEPERIYGNEGTIIGLTFK